MSQISDAIAAVSTAVDSATSRVQTDVANFNQQIATLQAQVDAGTASPADIQALADLVTRVNAIDPANPQVLPTT